MTTTPQVRDQVIADAKSLPDLLSRAQEADPPLFKLLTASNAHNVWYAPLVSVVSWLSTHYALGWTPDTSSAVAGLILFVGVGAAHWIARQSAPAKTAIATLPGK